MASARIYGFLLLRLVLSLPHIALWTACCEQVQINPNHANSGMVPGAEALTVTEASYYEDDYNAGNRLGEERPKHKRMPLWSQALLLLAFWAAFLVLQVLSLRCQSSVQAA